MRKIFSKVYEDGSVWELYLDEETGTIRSYEASPSRIQELEVRLARDERVQEVYYKDALVESGQCPDFG